MMDVALALQSDLSEDHACALLGEARRDLTSAEAITAWVSRIPAQPDPQTPH